MGVAEKGYFQCLANNITHTSRQIETEKAFYTKEIVVWLEIKSIMSFSHCTQKIETNMKRKMISVVPYQEKTDKVKLKWL